MERSVECLLHVTGDSVMLNTFDKTFRGGPGPQWPDRSCDGQPRYSLHALYPVPEDVQNRGYQATGKLWCPEYWTSTDDLIQIEVKRRLRERCYHFLTPGEAPDNAILKASWDFPCLRFELTFLENDGTLCCNTYHEGFFQGCRSPHGTGGFLALREEMGFAA